MKSYKIEIFECEYCKKYYKRKHFAIKHEKQCHRNPENFRACLGGCGHLTYKNAKVHIRIDEYYTHAPIYQDKNLLYCSKKKIFLYPPVSEHKGTYYTDFHDDEQQNNPMPKECDDRVGF
ncbi:MAG: hypothetical protein GY775_19255 [Candidatus Scalindua sp.]|nr:hypothetical protein [Candidatus Scalindua sp.]